MTLSSAEASLAGEKEKESARGTMGGALSIFFDYCYFYRDTQRESLRRRETCWGNLFGQGQEKGQPRPHGAFSLLRPGDKVGKGLKFLQRQLSIMLQHAKDDAQKHNAWIVHHKLSNPAINDAESYVGWSLTILVEPLLPKRSKDTDQTKCGPLVLQVGGWAEGW